jgi:hypothetical protein
MDLRVSPTDRCTLRCQRGPAPARNAARRRADGRGRRGRRRAAAAAPTARKRALAGTRPPDIAERHGKMAAMGG